MTNARHLMTLSEKSLEFPVLNKMISDKMQELLNQARLCSAGESNPIEETLTGFENMSIQSKKA